ncbi:MAG: ABC transporter ATP-binding protein [Clostridia bacterium]
MAIKSSISLKNITKKFGSVVASNDVSLDVECGEVHALLGENGSGKSTLMNMLAGIYLPDVGNIFVDEQIVSFHTPKDAIKIGIGMVHQHFKLVELLTAKENIILGDNSAFFINDKKRTEKIENLCEKYGLAVNLDKKVYDMSVSEKQTVEILKVLYRGANLLILDEPTAVLTPQEIKVLFKIVRNMAEEGCAVIIITHKMGEVMEISDKVTVLRKGESIKTLQTKSTNPVELTELMVGHAISLDIERPTVADDKKQEILDIKNVSLVDKNGINVLKDVSFTLNSGEILGIAGIAGSGQKELCEAIAGLLSIKNGDIVFKKESIIKFSPREIIQKGISMSFIPEDRLGMGLVAGMNIIDNMLLKTYRNKKGLFVDRKEGKRLADEIIEKFSINTPSSQHIVKKLSGGNIQKVLLGREINLNPELLITAYPVRGLDIGASYHIYDILNEQKQKGVGIIFVGEDLDVLISISDRILVMNGGEVMDIIPACETTKEEIGMLMMGHRGDEEGLSA